jgi:hypothetical protein
MEGLHLWPSGKQTVSILSIPVCSVEGDIGLSGVFCFVGMGDDSSFRYFRKGGRYLSFRRFLLGSELLLGVIWRFAWLPCCLAILDIGDIDRRLGSRGAPISKSKMAAQAGKRKKKFCHINTYVFERSAKFSAVLKCFTAFWFQFFG